jgi:hypothetical protein
MTRFNSAVRRFCLTAITTSTLGLLAWGLAAVVPGWLDLTPVAAQVIAPILIAPWTAIGASGTVDETSIPFFGFTNASAGYKPTASVAPLEFRYNVVNTQHAINSVGAGIPSITQPGWTTLEFGAQAPATSTAEAFLYRVNRCTGQQTLICQVRHTDQAAPGTCKTCQFPNTTFNFASYLYYVRVGLDRNTTGELPAAHTLRIY